MSTKVIRITAKTYFELAKRGTLRDTFDTVIQKLLKSGTDIKNGKKEDYVRKDSPPSHHNPPTVQEPLERDPGYG
jgi:hypothetical protein